MMETEERIDSKFALLETEKSKLKRESEKMSTYCDRSGMEIEDRLSHLMKGEVKLRQERDEMARLRADILK